MEIISHMRRQGATHVHSLNVIQNRYNIDSFARFAISPKKQLIIIIVKNLQ